MRSTAGMLQMLWASKEGWKSPAQRQEHAIRLPASSPASAALASLYVALCGANGVPEPSFILCYSRALLFLFLYYKNGTTRQVGGVE